MTTPNEDAQPKAETEAAAESAAPEAAPPADSPAASPPAGDAPATDAAGTEAALDALSTSAETETTAPRRPRGRRERRNVPRGRAYIQSTFNNTLITLTDLNGNVIAWSSAGSTGTKGSRKSTPFAAQMAAENAARKAMDNGMREIDVYVKGPGSGRESAVRALQAAGLTLHTIRDITPIPHNGCRPRKRRRV